MGDAGPEDAVEACGRSVEEAVRAVLLQLGVRAEDAEVSVLDEGARGWLGLGARPARARARRLNKGEAAERFLRRLATLVGSPLRVEVSVPGSGAEDGWAVDVQSDDPGRWIGRHGRGVDALQLLCEVAAARASGDRRRLSLDVGGYRGRRTQVLEATARRMADAAKRLGREVALEPMPAADRRVVHAAVQGIPGVRTESTGEEPRRHVIIVPDGVRA